MIGLILALLLGICVLFLLPLDYIRYKRSSYYKNEHRKYKFFAGSGIYFELYNEIAENNLPIKYLRNPQNDALECGWFVFNRTLIIPDSMVTYYPDVDKWFCEVYDGGHGLSSMPLEEYIKQEIDEINELFGSDVCDRAILLRDATQTDNLELAQQESSFLIYDDNRAEVLKAFCEQQST